MLRKDGDRLAPHYDPAIAVPFTRHHAGDGRRRRGRALGSVTTRCAARRCCCAAPTPTCCRATRPQEMTQRGPSARLHEFAGVGHAPTLVAARADRGGAGVPAVAMKTRCGRAAPRRPHRSSDCLDVPDEPMRRPAAAPDARAATAPGRSRCSARARSPSRCLPGARCSTPARPRWRMPTASAGILAEHRRRAGVARGGLSWSMPPTSLQRPTRCVTQRSSASRMPALVAHTRKLVQMQRAARRGAASKPQTGAQQTERVRKMLLAFSRDLRVVLLRLASRLQTLRWFAASKQPCAPSWRASRMQVFAPLANRLGIWQIKWELEDLAFRFLRARELPARSPRRSTRGARDREARIDDACAPSSRPTSPRTASTARGAGPAEAPLQHLEEDAGQGRRLRAGLRHAGAARHRRRRRRTAMPRWRACTSAVHADRRRVRRLHRQAQGQRLPVAAHRGASSDDGRPLEMQIRTREMHEHAEHGVAAHWAYKEAGAERLRRRQRRGGSRSASPRRAGGAAPAAGLGARPRRRDDAARARSSAEPVRRPHLRASRRRRTVVELPRGRDADRLRLRGAHRPGPSLPRRARSTARWCR